MQVRNETGRTSSISKQEVFLTQHHQSHFPHVDTRRLLDLALVGGGVRAPQIRHGDGGVALRGVPREGEPGRDPGVTVPMHLTPSVGQDLEGKDRLKQVFPLLELKGPALPSPHPEYISASFCRVGLLRQHPKSTETPASRNLQLFYSPK